jgi:hypothetical protein
VAGSILSKDELAGLFLEGFDTIDEAIAAALERYGKKATFLVIPNASDITPVITG